MIELIVMGFARHAPSPSDSSFTPLKLRRSKHELRPCHLLSEVRESFEIFTVAGPHLCACCYHVAITNTRRGITVLCAA